jgi:ABC-type dipeptide/oligopeptide/nickel transport system permease subunit
MSTDARAGRLVIEGDEPAVTVPGFWAKAWGRLLRNRLAAVSLVVLVLLCAVALLAPVVAPQSPSQQNLGLGEQYAGPSWSHLMGTDGLGRDWFSRLVYGTRVSLAVGIVSQLIVLGIGLPLGLIAGLRRGTADSGIMRFTDLAYAFPDLLLVILLRGVIGGNLLMLILIIGAVSWMDVTRLARGQVLSLREREFVVASATFTSWSSTSYRTSPAP